MLFLYKHILASVRKFNFNSEKWQKEGGGGDDIIKILFHQERKRTEIDKIY